MLRLALGADSSFDFNPIVIVEKVPRSSNALAARCRIRWLYVADEMWTSRDVVR